MICLKIRVIQLNIKYLFILNKKNYKLKIKNMKQPILSLHHLNYLETINKNKNLTSQYLTDLEVHQLYNKKYKITEFDIYKYIVALDYIRDSLNSKLFLTEGITKDKNKYNNILIDLFYHNIPSNIIKGYSIS